MVTGASSAATPWRNAGRTLASVFPLPLGVRLALWGAAFVTGLMGHLQLSIFPVPDSDPVLRHIPFFGGQIDDTSLGRGLVYLAVATVFIVLACCGKADEERPDEAAAEGASIWERLRPRALPLALLFIALGLGIAFRLYLLSSKPFGIWFDEAQNGIIADRMVQDSHYRPVFITEYLGTNRPALPVYVYALGVQLLGRDILALRSVSAVAGMLTLVPLFLLGRELFGWRVGALATFLLAVMRWHLNFSRLAMEPIWGPFFTVAALYFLVRGVKHGRWYDFAASGLFLGLGLYFYWAFLLVPLLYATYTAHSFLMRQSAKLAPLAAGALIVAVVGFLVYSPVAVYGYQHPTTYQARAHQVSITNDKDWGDTIAAVVRTTRKHVLMFNSQGDSNGRHNLSGSPMLDKFTAVFFVLGIGLSLSRIWQPRYFLLIAWLVVLLQPAIWSVEFEAPQALRGILITPAVALLAALPLAALWDMVSPRRALAPAETGATPGAAGESRRAMLSQYGRDAAAGLAGLALLFFLAQTAYHNYNTYFNKQLNDPRSWSEFNGDVTFVARELDRLQAGHRFLVSSLFAGPVLEFVYPPSRDLGSIALDPTRDLPLSESRSTAVFLDLTKGPFFQWLRTLYPRAQLREVKQPGEGQPTVVYEVIVEPEEIDRLRGVEATYRAQDGDVIARREPKIDFDWTSSPPAPFPFAAQWAGQINITTYGDHELSVQAPGRIVLHLDGEVLAEGEDAVTVTRRLFRGRHQLQLEVAAGRPGRVVLSDNGEPLPESAYFAPLPEGTGLLATFYTTADWSGEPALEQLDPFVGFRYHAELPFGSPFSVIWRGKLRVPLTGPYQMEIGAVDRATVLIDGLTTLAAPGASAGEVQLTEGLHDIEVRFTNAAGFAEVYLYWTRSGHDREVIPSNYLYPR